MRLLIVEDHEALGGMVAAHFREHGFAVDAVRSGGAALEAADAAVYDAALLDLGLPDMDGLAVLCGLRASQAAMPILILTARDHIEQRISGLDAGADDYILKPFELAELEARLRAVMRRPGLRRADCYKSGNISFDPVDRTITVGGSSTDLTRREGALLEALLRGGDRVMVRDRLAEILYGVDGDVSANALEATVSRLRRKLVLLHSTLRLESARGIGYRLRVAGQAT